MAVNSSRSQNRDLTEGMTDGKYKKLATRERGGEIDHATAMSRKHLSPVFYGDQVEAPIKVRPDGKLG